MFNEMKGTMDTLKRTSKCEKFIRMDEKIKQLYPEAKFDLFMTETSLDRIVSFNKYIIVAWIGDVCCGASTEGHHEPKTYIVHGASDDFITMHDIIRTLVEKGFEVPCDFKCFEDVTPAVNPIDTSESVYFYSLHMTYFEK
jgi:hypothetical protein